MTNDVQTGVRLPSTVLKDVDELAKKMSRPGAKVTRASVIRMLVIRGVSDLKKKRE